MLDKVTITAQGLFLQVLRVNDMTPLTVSTPHMHVQTSIDRRHKHRLVSLCRGLCLNRKRPYFSGWLKVKVDDKQSISNNILPDTRENRQTIDRLGFIRTFSRQHGTYLWASLRTTSPQRQIISSTYNAMIPRRCIFRSLLSTLRRNDCTSQITLAR